MIARFKKGPRHVVDHLNQMVEQINRNAKVLGGGAVQTSQTLQGRTNIARMGYINPRIPRFPKGTSFKVFEVQSNATGDGVYGCYAQTLDATEWEDTDGTVKFDDENTDSVEVLNLAEFDPEAEYVRHLAAGDLLLAWPMADDEGNSRYIGVPFRQANADRPRLAYCSADAGSGNTISAKLDNSSGTSITVTCYIAQQGTAGNLNAAVPRLKSGDVIMVTKVGATWRCLTTFMQSEDCDCYSA